MTRLRRAKILFFVEIFLQLFHVILAEKIDFDGWSDDDERSFFGIANSSIPDVGYGKIVRSRRSITSAPSVTIQVTFSDVSFTTTLEMVTDKFLADDTITGIWKARSSLVATQNVAYTPAPEIFNDIGPFEFFQNVDDGSAVTRFHGSTDEEYYEGILKQKYIIKTLPKSSQSKKNKGVWKCPFGKNFKDSSPQDAREECVRVVISEGAPIVDQYKYKTKGSLLRGNQRRTRHRRENSNDKPTTVYPELLIAPDYTPISATNTVVDVVKRVIVQFNSVDVLYRQLNEPAVRLSIVGIIVPEDEHVKPYEDSEDEYLDGTKATKSAKDFFELTKNSRKFNDYDILIIITEKTLRRTRNKGRIEINEGAAWLKTFCKKGLVIAKRDDCTAGIQVIAKQIARVFGVLHDAGKKCPPGNGNIMVSDFENVKTLTWSKCSRQNFKSIFRSKTERCIKNPPKRVDHSVKRLPGTWLDHGAQCLNKVSNSAGACFNPKQRHCESYGCDIDRECIFVKERPLEGTIIGMKRCINGNLVPI